MLAKKYVELEEAYREVSKEKDDWHDSFAKSALQRASFRLLNMQAADVTPVVRGRWLTRLEAYEYSIEAMPDDYVCSVCLERFNLFDNDVDRFDFCPKCSARMDLEETRCPD